MGLSILLNLYCRWRGYRIGPVDSPAEMARHNRLVQEVFFKANLFDSPNTPLLPHDSRSISRSFMARQRQSPVGALTVVQNPVELPVEEFFNVRLPPNVLRNQLAEVTRFVIEPEHRIQDPALSMALLNAALNYSRHNGIRWWIWCAPSVFLWGFQSYFQDCQVLNQLPPRPAQLALREGREAYFDPARAIRVVLVDLDTISMTDAAIKVLDRRKKRLASRRVRSLRRAA